MARGTSIPGITVVFGRRGEGRERGAAWGGRRSLHPAQVIARGIRGLLEETGKEGAWRRTWRHSDTVGLSTPDFRVLDLGDRTK